MAHFSNGTEGLIYCEQYCFQCLNYEEQDDDSGCVIWNLHFLLVGVGDAREVLNYLIPRKGGVNGRCLWYDRPLRVRDFSEACEMSVEDWELVHDPPQESKSDLELWQNLCV